MYSVVRSMTCPGLDQVRDELGMLDERARLLDADDERSGRTVVRGALLGELGRGSPGSAA